MDFEKILHVARKNELNKKEPVKCLQTKFKPPSKEQREKDKALSEGVQRFLAKKEEEEKQKQKEAERRKAELMALRAKDPKANRRIQTMLKRTKSANKSVMEDAVNNNNTADTLTGPHQPDEDDYGFVSETSSQLYNKLIQKMYSSPRDDQPKFAPSKKPNSGNLSNTKERVKMALLKQEEEDKLPHRRKRKGKSGRDEEDNSHLDYSAPDRDMSTLSTEKYEREKEAPKVRKPVPPPMDFHELLKIAEQKQHEPIVFEPKEKKSDEPEVLMTKKQKLEYERMQEWKRKRELGLHNSDSKTQKDDKGGLSKRIPKVKSSMSSSGVPTKIPKVDETRSTAKVNNPNGKDRDAKSSSAMKPDLSKSSASSSSTTGSQKPKAHTPKTSDQKYKDDETSRLIKERDEALRILKEKERLIRERDEAVRKLKEKEQLIRERDEAVRKLKMLERAEKMGKSAPPAKASSSPLKPSSAAKSVGAKSDGGKVCSKPNGTNGRPVVSKDAGKISDRDKVPQKSLPGRDTKVKAREFPPRDLKPIKQFPPPDVRRRPPMKKRRIDSEDEYDSELDDFIDDGDADVGPEDVSKVISEIFRYDKNRYSRYDDDDDECMESNFAQISKEEYFSTKCGILEDLQDIQKEKAALARKKMKR